MMDLIKTSLGTLTATGNGDARQALPGQHLANIVVSGTGAVSAAGSIQGTNDLSAPWKDIGAFSISGTDSAAGTVSWSMDYLYWRLVATGLTGSKVGAIVASESFEKSSGLATVVGVDGRVGLDDYSKTVVQSARIAPIPQRALSLLRSPVWVSGGRASVEEAILRALVPMDPRAASTLYYVDVVNGSDSNNGSSWALAFKSIWKATTAGNTAAVPFWVKVAANRYSRANAFCNAGPTVIPTQPCVFEAIGGIVECHVGDANGVVAYTLDAGTTWKGTRSNVTRVLDWLNVNTYGDYVEFTKVATQADCRATPGSWYTDGTTVYINRTDGVAVTGANTAALLTTVEGVKSPNSGSNMHLIGFSQIGGTNGAFQLANNGAGKVLAVDCKFNWSTNSTYVDNVTSLDCALVVLIRCASAYGQKDGFNFHAANSVIPNVILLDCKGYENGTVPASTSNNGVTIHDAGLLIDINGRYFNNHGGDFAHANSGTMAVGICTQTMGSYGDIERSGGVALPGTGFHSVLGADIYKIDCVGADQITGSGTISKL